MTFSFPAYGVPVRRFVVIPSLRINAKYYGWRFCGLSRVGFTVSAVSAGMAIHALFWALGLIPDAEAGRGEQMAESASITLSS